MEMEGFLKKLEAAQGWLVSEYTNIRTGQAAPGILDNVRVESYGTKVPLNQVGSINIEDARTLRVSAWDGDSVGDIERAILDADLGVGVITDSSGLRVTFPELTGERREQLLKLAKTKLEEARVRVKSARDDMMKSIDSKAKDKEISEDDMHREKENAQNKVEEMNKKLEELYEQKEKEINS